MSKNPENSWILLIVLFFWHLLIWPTPGPLHQVVSILSKENRSLGQNLSLHFHQVLKLIHFFFLFQFSVTSSQASCWRNSPNPSCHYATNHYFSQWGTSCHRYNWRRRGWRGNLYCAALNNKRSCCSLAFIYHCQNLTKFPKLYIPSMTLYCGTHNWLCVQ